MYTHCLCRLSRVSLSNAQHLFSTTNKPPGRPRFPPDLWRSFLLHEQLAVNPQPDAVAPEPHSISAASDKNMSHKIAETPDANSTTAHGRGSFRVKAPTASINVAEMAAALALASFGSVHTTTLSELPCAIFPTSIQSSSRATPLITVLDNSLARSRHLVPSSSPVRGDDGSNGGGRGGGGVDAAITAAFPTPAPHTPSLTHTSTAATDTVEIPVAAKTFPLITSTSAGVDTAGVTANDLNADLHHYMTVRPFTDTDTDTAPDTALTSPAAFPDPKGLVVIKEEYLPVQLRSMVPISMAEYWHGVSEATRVGQLHATIFISAKAWAQAAPTITAMLSADGNGPAGQVRFALVPLGEDYAVRADAAHRASPVKNIGGGSVAAAAVSTVASLPHDLATRFGLDVALAAAAAAAADGGRGGGVRRLETCPAMVVRGGYTGSVRVYGGEVCPGWSMRQELDMHVWRNLHSVQQQQQQTEVRQEQQVQMARQQHYWPQERQQQQQQPWRRGRRQLRLLLQKLQQRQATAEKNLRRLWRQQNQNMIMAAFARLDDAATLHGAGRQQPEDNEDLAAAFGGRRSHGEKLRGAVTEGLLSV